MYEVYYKEKNGVEHHLGVKKTKEEAEAFKKDSVRLAKVWECDKKYSYHVRKVKE